MLAFRQLGFYNCRYLECWLRSCQLLDSYNQRWTEEKGKGYLGLSFRSRLPQKNLNFDTDVVAWPPSSFYSLWVSSEQSLIPFDTSKKKKAKKNPAFRWQLRCTSFWVHLQALGETSVQGTPPKKGLKNRASRYTETERHDFSTKTKQNKTERYRIGNTRRHVPLIW